MFSAALAAYAFAQMEFPGKGFLFTLMLSTLMLPEAITWVPNFITVSWLGRISPVPWLNNWPSLTIPFMASAFGIFLLRQFFQQIPRELWDSAQNRWVRAHALFDYRRSTAFQAQQL